MPTRVEHPQSQTTEDHTGTDATVAYSRLTVPVVSPATTYPATTADCVILADGTSGAFDVTLPLAASATNQVFMVKKTDVSANAITVEGNGAETIDGVANKPLAAQYDFIVVVSDATEWHVVGIT